MTSSGQTSHISVYESVGDAQASCLLRLGLVGPRRPIDDLADRLADTGSSGWLDATLEIGATAAIGSGRSTLVVGTPSIEDLKKIKNEGKRRYRFADSVDGRLGGLAIYFVAIASALVHHRANICSRSPQVLHDALVDLAAVASGPWSDMLTRAAAVATALPPSDPISE